MSSQALPNLATLAIQRGHLNPEDDGRFPLLPAYSDRGALHVFCAHCNTFHRHGGQGGHKVAHCFDPTSPYEGVGYVLVVVGPVTPMIRAEMRRRKKRNLRT